MTTLVCACVVCVYNIVPVCSGLSCTFSFVLSPSLVSTFVDDVDPKCIVILEVIGAPCYSCFRQTNSQRSKETQHFFIKGKAVIVFKLRFLEMWFEN